MTGPTDADLRRLLLIRHFETALLELFAAGHLAGTTHTCLGQEPVAVALAGLLDDGDFEFSNHRGHGHYLARFDDPAGLLAEIMGRDGAVCGGVGGSQHLLRGRFLSTGVQGESLPVAAGAALHLARSEPGKLACAHIGDGTWGAGAVYEALNMAVLWRLPLVVAVEHNGIAQSTPTAAQLAGTIAGRAAGFGAAYLRVADSTAADSTAADSTADGDGGFDGGVAAGGVAAGGVADIVAAVRDQVAGPLARVRDGAGPLVVEFVTRRLGPHSKGDDARPPETLAALRGHDWYPRYARACGERFARFDAEQRDRVAAVVAEVSARPPAASPSSLDNTTESPWQLVDA